MPPIPIQNQRLRPATRRIVARPPTLARMFAVAPACMACRLAAIVCCAVLAGCHVFDAPSNYRNWTATQSQIPRAEYNGDEVTVHNVRNCTYLSEDNYVLKYEDRTYRLSDVEAVDFIVVPFGPIPAVAHTMMSFQFKGGQHLVVSVEIRKEVGEKYDPLIATFNQFEIIYVVGDERDLIKLRANFEKDDVLVYRTRATPQQAQKLFVDVMTRVNKLNEQPEFYNTLVNNCTTNVRRHINDLAPDRVPYDYRVLLPGLSDELAYDIGLLDTTLPFAEAKRRANVSTASRMYPDAPDYSEIIRR